MTKMNKEIHTPNAKMTYGDNYGSGIRNKMARSIDVFGLGKQMTKKENKPPKALA